MYLKYYIYNYFKIVITGTSLARGSISYYFLKNIEEVMNPLVM